jgi:hypothetical protein
MWFSYLNLPAAFAFTLAGTFCTLFVTLLISLGAGVHQETNVAGRASTAEAYAMNIKDGIAAPAANVDKVAPCGTL